VHRAEGLPDLTQQFLAALHLPGSFINFLRQVRPQRNNSLEIIPDTASLFTRFASRQDDSPQMKMIAALRNQFGGHAVESTKGK
jgi:hypothetical protein